MSKEFGSIFYEGYYIKFSLERPQTTSRLTNEGSQDAVLEWRTHISGKDYGNSVLFKSGENDLATMMYLAINACESINEIKKQ